MRAILSACVLAATFVVPAFGDEVPKKGSDADVSCERFGSQPLTAADICWRLMADWSCRELATPSTTGSS